jgi:hypothetical protein
MDTPRILGVTEGALGQFLLAFALLFVLYVVAFMASLGHTSRRSAVAVLAGGALLSAALLLMHPGGAGDIYAYIACADVVLLYGGNPYVTPPAAFPEYPLLGFVDVPGETIQYGPLWLLVTLALRAPFLTNLLLTMLAFKVAAAATLLGIAWLTYLILRRSNPSFAVPGMLLVAWNPLLIFELAGNAHNDGAMMVLVMLAFYFRARRRHAWAIGSLLAAALIKYVAAIFVPLFLVAMLREAGPAQQWMPRAVGFGLGASAAGLGLLAVTTLDGTVGAILSRTEMFTTSPAAVAHLWLSETMDPAQSAHLVLRTGQIAFAAIFLVQVWRVWTDPARLVPSTLYAVLAFMFLVMSWYQPWYVVWAVPLAALVATPASVAMLIGLTVGSALIHAVMGFGWRLGWHQGSMLLIQSAGVVSAWLPVALALALSRALWRRLPSWSTASPRPRLVSAGREPTVQSQRESTRSRRAS